MKKDKKDHEHWFDIGMLSNVVASRIETRDIMPPEQAIKDAKKEQDWIDRDLEKRKGEG
jgi:hypothetical protein